MSDTPDGGPAFPSVELVEEYNSSKQQYVSRPASQHGMKLRDYFAAHALNSIYFNDRIGDDAKECAEMARLAYDIADAMIAERSKP